MGPKPYEVHRWYQPSVGRKTLPDPAGIGVEDPTNLYLYAEANPLLFVDPRGHLPIEPPGLFFVCGVALGMQMQNAFPGANDEFRGCAVSSEIQLSSGIAGSTAEGIGNEILDALGPGNADFGDLVADFDGIRCAQKLENGKLCGDCESCCT